MCLIGFISGDKAGQGKTFTLFCARKFAGTRAVWGLALSCWKNKPGPKFCMNGRWLLFRRLTLRWALRLPYTTIRSVLTLPMIPPHTITLPPPNLSRSLTQHWAYLSFLRRYTRTLPSACLTLNRDSSLKTTLYHWRRVQCRWRWAALWRAVRIGQVYSLRARIGMLFCLRQFRIVWAFTPSCRTVSVVGKNQLRKCVSVI